MYTGKTGNVNFYRILTVSIYKFCAIAIDNLWFYHIYIIRRKELLKNHGVNYLLLLITNNFCSYIFSIIIFKNNNKNRLSTVRSSIVFTYMTAKKKKSLFKK